MIPQLYHGQACQLADLLIDATPITDDAIVTKLKTIAHQAGIRSETPISLLCHHKLANNHSRTNRQNALPLVYAIDDLIKNNLPFDRLLQVLNAIINENAPDYFHLAHIDEMLATALQHHCPSELYWRCIPLIPQPEQRAFLSMALQHNQDLAAALIFDYARASLSSEEKWGIIPRLLDSKHLLMLEQLLTPEFLNLQEESALLALKDNLLQGPHDAPHLLQRLIQAGLAPEQDWLYQSLQNKKPKCTTLCLALGLSPNTYDATGRSALHHAIITQQHPLFPLLNDYHADFFLPTQDERPILTLTEDETTLKAIRRFQVQHHSTPLAPSTIQYLALRGGGSKSYAYPFAIKEAIEKGVFTLEKIKGVSGASAGAIGAMFIALGYDKEEMVTIMSELNMMDFLDPIDEQFYAQKDAIIRIIKNYNSGFGSGTLWTALSPYDLGKAKQLIQTLTTHRGLFKGEAFKAWLCRYIGEKIATSTLPDDIKAHPELVTFKDLEHAHFKDLHIVATDASRKTAIWFNAKNTPNALVADTVRASMSIPVGFVPHAYYIRQINPDGQFERVIHPDFKDSALVDGGMFENYPTKIFDEEDEAGHRHLNPHVLGLYLATPEEKYSLEEGIAPEAVNLTHPWRYFLTLLGIVYEQQEYSHAQQNERHRTIYINTGDTQPFDFSLSPGKKYRLMQEGRKSVQDYLNRTSSLTPIAPFSQKTLLHLLHFGAIEQPHMTSKPTHLTLNLRALVPWQMVSLYAHLDPSELAKFKKLVNLNCCRDALGNTPLHVAIAIQKAIEHQPNDEHHPLYGLSIGLIKHRLQNAIDHLNAHNPHPLAKNFNNKMPHETVQGEIESPPNDFLLAYPQEHQRLQTSSAARALAPPLRDITRLLIDFRVRIRQENTAFLASLRALEHHRLTLIHESLQFLAPHAERKRQKAHALHHFLSYFQNERQHAALSLQEIETASDEHHTLRLGLFGSRTAYLLDRVYEAERRAILDAAMVY